MPPNLKRLGATFLFSDILISLISPSHSQFKLFSLRNCSNSSIESNLCSLLNTAFSFSFIFSYHFIISFRFKILISLFLLYTIYNVGVCTRPTENTPSSIPSCFISKVTYLVKFIPTSQSAILLASASK